MRKRVWLAASIILLILFLKWISNVIYSNYFSPIYTWQQGYQIVEMNGTYYSISRLVLGDKAYVDEPLADPSRFQFGQQIGRTQDGMRIFEVKNDRTRIMLTGFMFPQTIFKKQ